MINTTLIESDRGNRPDDVRQPPHDNMIAGRCQVLQSVLKDEVRVIVNTVTLPTECREGSYFVKQQRSEAVMSAQSAAMGAPGARQVKD